jgi:hypothetical protein
LFAPRTGLRRDIANQAAAKQASSRLPDTGNSNIPAQRIFSTITAPTNEETLARSPQRIHNQTLIDRASRKVGCGKYPDRRR